jgi:hypothetical protein
MASGAAHTVGPMLREVKNAAWESQGLWLWKRYVFAAGRARAARGVRPAELARLEAMQGTEAVAVLADEGRRYWWCLGRFYWEDDGLSPQDVFALAFQRQDRARRRLERAHQAVHLGQEPSALRRLGIPRELRQAVYDRDGGRCVQCEATFDLQYDHVIPVALGGATSFENLELLCGPCNREKGASL